MYSDAVSHHHPTVDVSQTHMLYSLYRLQKPYTVRYGYSLPAKLHHLDNSAVHYGYSNVKECNPALHYNSTLHQSPALLCNVCLLVCRRSSLCVITPHHVIRLSFPTRTRFSHSGGSVVITGIIRIHLFPSELANAAASAAELQNSSCTWHSVGYEVHFICLHFPENYRVPFRVCSFNSV